MLFRPHLRTQAAAIESGSTQFALESCGHADNAIERRHMGTQFLDSQTVSNPRVSSQSVTADSVAIHSARACAA
jgi:hypothetical protein